MIIISKYSQYWKRNLQLAVPVMMSQLGHVLVGFGDSAMVGQLGEVPLAASSFANSVFFLFICFGIGFSMGISPLIARADGEKNSKKSKDLFVHSLVLSLAMGVLLFLVVLASTNYLHILSQPQEVLEAAYPYLLVISLSIIPFMVFQSLRQFSEGLSFTKEAMWISLVANLINLFLNYLLIYGHAGFPKLGLIGAGWATFIARVLMVVFYFLLLKYHPRLKQYLKGLRSTTFQKDVFGEIIKIGFPSAFQFTFEVSAFVFAAIMVGWLGATSLAAHQIAMSCAMVSYMMASGLSSAMAIRVGNYRGMKDYVGLREVGYSIIQMVIVFELIWMLLFIFGRDVLPILFIDDPDVILVSSSLLVLAAFFQISDGIQVVGLSGLRALSDTRIPTYMTLISYWIIGLPVGYLLGFSLDMGAEGVWWGLIFGLSASAIAMLVRFEILTKSKRSLSVSK